jgi:thiamine biosynthesis lipoprotein
MGSLATITLYADTPDQAQRAFVSAFARIARLNRILSDYDPESELSRVCQIQDPLSAELSTVLTYTQRIAADTDGAFDITVGPLTHLWRTARREKRLPGDTEITGALARSGFRKLLLHNGRVHCEVSGMQLDAGGIAKGFAADEALAVLSQAGIKSALVALSGDIAMSDAPPGKSGWKIRVLNQTLTLSNAAVSTSGDEFQFIEVGGARYSHILDPRIGKPLQNSRPVSVIAKSGIEADSLATALSVLEPERTRAVISGRQVCVISSEKTFGPACPIYFPAR